MKAGGESEAEGPKPIWPMTEVSWPGMGPPELIKTTHFPLPPHKRKKMPTVTQDWTDELLGKSGCASRSPGKTFALAFFLKKGDSPTTYTCKLGMETYVSQL